MKRSGIGEDLEALISGKSAAKVSETDKKILILSILSERPCSTSYNISSAMGVSERGVLWHLRSMVRMEILFEVDMEGKHRFYIRSHIIREHCHIFSLLCHGKIRRIFAMIIEKPGINHSEICEKFGMSRQSLWKNMKKLVESDLITELRDGRNTRYYPSKKTMEMAAIYEERRDTAAYVIERDIRRLGLECRLIAHRNGILHMKIGEKEESFSTDPFRSSMEG